MGLFDSPSPQQVQQELNRRGMLQDAMYARVPRGRGFVAAAAGAGRQLGQALSGPNPEVQKAQKMQKVQQTLMQSGIEFGTPEFFDTASRMLQSEGLAQEAMQVKMQGAEYLSNAQTAEATNAYKLAQAEKMLRGEAVKPSSTIGKLVADRKAGLISDEEYKLGLEKLKGKKGTALRVNADGSVEFSENVALSTAPTTKTKNDLQKGVVDALGTLQTLDSIAGKYRDDFLTYQGQLRSGGSRMAEKFGVDVGKENRKYLAERTKFKTSVQQFFNRYRKEITGAAASVQELKMLKESMFNEDMSPTEFQAAFDEFKTKAEAQLKLKQKLLAEGVPVKEIGERIDAGEWAEMVSGEAATQGKAPSVEDLVNMYAK